MFRSSASLWRAKETETPRLVIVYLQNGAVIDSTRGTEAVSRGGHFSPLLPRQARDPKFVRSFHWTLLWKLDTLKLARVSLLVYISTMALTKPSSLGPLVFAVRDPGTG